MCSSARSVLSTSTNSTYTNPILPGWHSDPSCTFVPEEDNTFFCTVSSFLSFPGIPIYASKDLLHWKLVSNAVTRPEQVPEIANSTSQTQQDGLWASTLRYRQGRFYLLTSYVSMYPTFQTNGLLFTTTDIYSDDAWSDPVRFQIGDIDPDIFWDDDGTAYVSYAGISQQTINLETGATGPATKIWTGTGGATPEGPHIYKKDGWYYLCIGEGGTELGHRQTIARSRNVSGPYDGYGGNPILTNLNTTEYFQTVGHADLFQDADGNWWGTALATRSGPAWRVYPMGRETVLFPVTWNEGEWPILEPVRGRMSGWRLPQPRDRMIPGNGGYVDASDNIDFAPGTSIPRHFLFWRLPKTDAFAVSPVERPYSLRLLPSQHNLTGPVVPGVGVEQTAITLVTRRQSHTYFTYSVDVSFAPTKEGEETGVTIFLTQYQHIDLGVVLLPSAGKLVPHLRFQMTLLDDLNTPATQNVTVPESVVKALPLSSKEVRARLQIQAVDDAHYILSAALPDLDKFKFSQHVDAVLVSGGTGRFTGTLLGAYATSNGGTGSTPAYISRWRYEGQGQKISENSS
ncbi:glycosyl hydrolase [Aspergillus ambiguus]|uniref:glycosyl hydrolase n=1 Tax=Aspergillus ambiguus TaxID=176160 RepID=UPI003CCE0304